MQGRIVGLDSIVNNDQGQNIQTIKLQSILGKDNLFKFSYICTDVVRYTLYTIHISPKLPQMLKKENFIVKCKLY